MAGALTPQQIYDTAVRHLHRQGKRSGKEDVSGFSCLYRGPRGLMCGVGPFIPDALYDRRMEGQCVSELFSAFSGLKSAMIGRDPQYTRGCLLGNIQAAHDNPSLWNGHGRRKSRRLTPQMVQRLRSMAADAGLSDRALTELGYAPPA